jgi:hypothetical protein
LHSAPERFDDGVVVAVTDGAHRWHQSGPLCAVSEGPRCELHAVVGMHNHPGLGSRLAMAIPSALVTSAAVCEESIDHPMTRRENVSSTTAQYTFPS